MSSRIFVVGNSRSGTTMMARILRVSDHACDLRELHYIEQMVTGEQFLSDQILSESETLALARRLLSVIRGRYFLAAKVKVPDDEVLTALGGVTRMTRAEIYDRVTQSEAMARGASVPIDQTPRNVFYVEEILQKFPDSRIICMVRDPRDVVLSQKSKWKVRFHGGRIPVVDGKSGQAYEAKIPLKEALRSWANYHPLVVTGIWRQTAAVSQRIAALPQVLVVRFEDVLADPERLVRAAASHCGLEFDPAMLEVKQVGSSLGLDQASTGVDGSRTGRWKSALSSTEIAMCEAHARPYLEKFGYVESGIRGNPVTLAFFWAIVPLKLGLALLLNLDRIRNLSAWATKRFLSK